MKSTEVFNERINGYSFLLELEIGEGNEYTVWIQKDGKLVYYTGSETQAKRYFSTYSKRHIENFCKKFATNEAYRNDFLNKSN